MRSLGQKYMGVRPDSHADAIFKDTSVHVDANHPVPVSNFMNAQCMFISNSPNPRLSPRIMIYRSDWDLLP